ncbi:MAG: hypothetical protein LBD03_07465 [Methanobrevibacter sp.]|jgi:predicted outer membrane repeat protein|nr:hypothetical protein [Candidatus Methanovirga procula]
MFFKDSSFVFLLPLFFLLILTLCVFNIYGGYSDSIDRLVLSSGNDGVIYLNNHYYGGVGNRNIVISKNLTIIGNNNTVIDGNLQSRIFKVNPNCHLTLLNLSLVNGSSDRGGLIYCSDNASLDITNCKLSNSKAIYGGAGIYLSNSACLSNIINCSFIDNNVDAYYGGAIFNNNSSLNIENSVFKDNHAHFGGAIYNKLFSTKKTNIVNSTFESNNCDANGAAIYTIGGSGSKIQGSNFTRNYINPDIGSYGDGSALCVDGTKDFNIIDTNFKENKAVKGACIFNTNDGEVNILSSNLTKNIAGAGGAIYNDKGAVYITDISNIKNNIAYSHYGGAIVNKGFIKMTISNIDNNSCNRYGGAIYSTTGDIVIGDCELNNNIGNGTGGAISATDTNIEVTTTEFRNNVAGTGGAIHANNCKLNFTNSRRGDNSFVGNTATQFDGGALFLMGQTNGFIYNTVFESNKCSGKSGRGGAIFYGSDIKCINKTTNTTGSLVLLDLITYSGNTANRGSNVYSSKYGDIGAIGRK